MTVAPRLPIRKSGLIQCYTKLRFGGVKLFGLGREGAKCERLAMIGAVPV